MLKIGITGGIGSGKSLVCKIFEMQGIPVFYADPEAKALMHSNAELISAIKASFGEAIYNEEGVLDRKVLASIVFSDQRKLEVLNGLVHPAVFKAFADWVAKQSAPYVLKEAALLFESGSYKDCDLTVLVKSPLPLKIARVIKRDGVSEEEVSRRIAKQLTDEEKESMADYIIENNEIDLLIPQVIALHNDFLNKSTRY